MINLLMTELKSGDDYRIKWTLVPLGQIMAIDESGEGVVEAEILKKWDFLEAIK